MNTPPFTHGEVEQHVRAVARRSFERGLEPAEIDKTIELLRIVAEFEALPDDWIENTFRDETAKAESRAAINARTR